MGICESITSKTKKVISSHQRSSISKNDNPSPSNIIHNRKFERNNYQHYTDKPPSLIKLDHIINKNSIEDSNNFPHQRNNNRRGSKFERKNERSMSLIEKNNLGTKVFKEEIKLRVAINSLIDETIGLPTIKYQVLSKLGDGSFGTVFLAINQFTKAKVALKKIKKYDTSIDLSFNEKVSTSSCSKDQLIKNEINILKNLDHPNIVKIIEFYNTKKAYYIVNEYCPLGELFNQIHHRFTEMEIAVLFYQLFSGLCYLHENNICHRDIKLENILISNQEKDIELGIDYFWIKIIDFGTATIFQRNQCENVIVGSSYYIAPEVFKKHYNEKCDTWSAGVILYMLLVGRAPFDGSNDDIIISRIKKGLYNKKNRNLISASTEVQNLIRSLLEIKVDKRLSAKEALKHPWFTKFNAKRLYFNISNEKKMEIIKRLFSYQINSKFQQMVIAFIVHNIPENEDIRDVLKIFRQFNTSDNGKLTKEELRNGLGLYMDNSLVNKRINDLFLMLDSANNGYLEFEEFLRACLDKKQLFTNDLLAYAFNFINKDNSNKITVQNIIECFQQKNASKDVFNHLFSEVHKENEGAIDLNEFKEMMLEMNNERIVDYV